MAFRGASTGVRWCVYDGLVERARALTLILAIACAGACKKKPPPPPQPDEKSESDKRLEEARKATEAREKKEVEDRDGAIAAFRVSSPRFKSAAAAMSQAVQKAPPCSAKSGRPDAVAMTTDEPGLKRFGEGERLGLTSATFKELGNTPFAEADRRKRDYDPTKARALGERIAANPYLVVFRVTELVPPEVTGDHKFRSGRARARVVLFDDGKPICRVDAMAKNEGVVETLGPDPFPVGRLTNDLEKALRKKAEAAMIAAKAIKAFDPPY